MKIFIKPIVSTVVVTIYLLLLRYVAPSREPYFILGTSVVGLVAWLSGRIAGLATAALLIPMTNLVYSQFSVSTSYLSIAMAPANIAMQIIAAFALGHLRRHKEELDQKEAELENANERLKSLLSNVQELGGCYNLCSECKSIQDKDGNWLDMDTFLNEQTKIEFSHCMCPKCAEGHFHLNDFSA